MKNWKIELKIQAETLAKAVEKFKDEELVAVEEDEEKDTNKVGF